MTGVDIVSELWVILSCCVGIEEMKLLLFVLFQAALFGILPAGVWGQVPAESRYERVLAIVPMVGEGTYADPRRPMFDMNPQLRAETLLHELGHVYTARWGRSASRIIYDNPAVPGVAPGQSEENDNEVRSKCFP